jgi:hypothetical protein
MITNYAAGLILNEYFRYVNAGASVPVTMYLGLSTTTINATGTGATEPSGGGYARVSISTSTGNWSAPSAGIISNANAVTFPEATSSWGTITYVFLADASTSGNILYYEALSSSRTVDANTTVLFPASSIQILMNNS